MKKRLTAAIISSICAIGIAGFAVHQLRPAHPAEPATVIYDKNGNPFKWRHETGSTRRVYDNKTHKMITIKVNPAGSDKK
ncbi:hypothetical protein [Lacticaseibacillus hegangensis]|uniref:Uncharacterized protein n=1 Tax=Lacticaseibacillus hegangensis TaxID=2486010 RepID=A0ABW4D0A7_9LACO|nr:hypothetical protein [Lacticaseibacillus hegangensis]